MVSSICEALPTSMCPPLRAHYTLDCVAIQYGLSRCSPLYADCSLDHLTFPIWRAESFLGPSPSCSITKMRPPY